jgi:hypothetical protein
VVAVSALVGLLLALPSRRLVGDYLAIVTLFFSQIFYILTTQGYRISFLGLNKDLGFDRANWDLTGGPNGIANVDRIGAFGLTASSERAYFYITLVRGRRRLRDAEPGESLTHGTRVESAPRRHAGRAGHERAGELAQAPRRRDRLRPSPPSPARSTPRYSRVRSRTTTTSRS